MAKGLVLGETKSDIVALVQSKADIVLTLVGHIFFRQYRCHMTSSSIVSKLCLDNLHLIFSSLTN